MSADQSSLSSTGFDYVVAVTQDSINATLEEYLYSRLPEVILCYVYNASNDPIPIEYATLVANAGNTDPFSVPDATPGSDARVQALNNASFAFAVKAKLGLPPGVATANLPPIVVLKPGQSNVTYTLMFSEFVATEIVFGPRDSMTWVNQSQPSGSSWTFSGPVDLNFQDASFTSLPPEVQARLKDIGDSSMFSVQQLYYDLNSSDLEQGFKFADVPSNSALNGFMTDDFIDTYWAALGGAEVLAYAAKQLSATPASSIAVTDVNFFTPDSIGNDGAPLTLNYLCATNNDVLPGTAQAGFGWNWIEAGEVSQYDGVAALNRNTFANYLNNAVMSNGVSLLQYVASNCYQPTVRVWEDGGVNYSWYMEAGQAPTVTIAPLGGVLGLLGYQFDSGTVGDQAGLDGWEGKMQLSCQFTMTVNGQGNELVIVQHLVIWTYVRVLATSASGNVVDKQITDTYTIGVGDDGHLTAALASSGTVDNSQSPGVNGFLEFFTHLNDLSQDVVTWAQGCAATSLTDVPVSFVENFVFPGGATFSFADASFATSKDLVSHITYADPT